MDVTGGEEKVDGGGKKKSLWRMAKSKLIGKKNREKRPSEELIDIPSHFLKQFSVSSRSMYSIESISSFEDEKESTNVKKTNKSALSNDHSCNAPDGRRSVIDSLWSMRSSTSEPEGLESTTELGGVFQLLSAAARSPEIKVEACADPSDEALHSRMESVLQKISGPRTDAGKLSSAPAVLPAPTPTCAHGNPVHSTVSSDQLLPSPLILMGIEGDTMGTEEPLVANVTEEGPTTPPPSLANSEVLQPLTEKSDALSQLNEGEVNDIAPDATCAHVLAEGIGKNSSPSPCKCAVSDLRLPPRHGDLDLFHFEQLLCQHPHFAEVLRINQQGKSSVDIFREIDTDRANVVDIFKVAAYIDTLAREEKNAHHSTYHQGDVTADTRKRNGTTGAMDTNSRNPIKLRTRTKQQTMKLLPPRVTTGYSKIRRGLDPSDDYAGDFRDSKDAVESNRDEVNSKWEMKQAVLLMMAPHKSMNEVRSEVMVAKALDDMLTQSSAVVSSQYTTENPDEQVATGVEDGPFERPVPGNNRHGGIIIPPHYQAISQPRRSVVRFRQAEPYEAPPDEEELALSEYILQGCGHECGMADALQDSMTLTNETATEQLPAPANRISLSESVGCLSPGASGPSQWSDETCQTDENKYSHDMSISIEENTYRSNMSRPFDHTVLTTLRIEEKMNAFQSQKCEDSRDAAALFAESLTSEVSQALSRWTTGS